MSSVPDDFGSEQSLLATLREALDETSEVPPSVLAGGYAAYAWRTIDSELAALTYDSTHDATFAGARSQQAGPRSVTFGSASCTIELEVTATGILGQIIPAGPSGVLLRLEDDTSALVPVDDMGCFTIVPLPSTRFRLQIAGPVKVSTDWIAL